MKTIKVISKIRFNDTVIDVAAGEKYDFCANGTWWDLFIPSGPNGFMLKSIMGTFPVVKGVPYFKLCGCLDKDYDTAFVIGRKLLNYEFKQNGRLYLFANDSIDKDKYYKNNRGSIKAIIRKVK